MRSLRRFIFALLLHSAFLIQLPAQCNMQWVHRFNVGTPGQRAHHAMAYNASSGRTVFFGGEVGSSGSEAYYNDTWEYDGTNWVKMNTSSGPVPSPRSFHSMVSGANEILLFGGSAGGDAYNDLWRYGSSGTNGYWQLVGYANTNGASAPPYLTGQGMVYLFDGPLLIGGAPRIYGDAYAHAYSSIWHYSDYVWSLTSLGFPHNAPEGIYGFGCALDTKRNFIVGVGGYQKVNETALVDPAYAAWIISSNSTGQVNACANILPGPSPRAESSLAYNANRDRMICVGGTVGGNETWEYSPDTGWLQGTSLPAGYDRAGAAMVWDSKRNVMVLMGGAGPGAPDQNVGGRYDDTWEYMPSPHTTVDVYTGSALCVESDILYIPGFDQTTMAYQRYQWAFPETNFDGTVTGYDIPGQTNFYFSLPASATNHAEFIRDGGLTPMMLKAWDECNNYYTFIGSLYIVQAPYAASDSARISEANGSNPLDDEVHGKFYRCPGDSILFTPYGFQYGNVTNEQLTFTWYHNGKLLSNESLDPTWTNSPGVLGFANLKPTDAGDYYLRIANPCGHVDSPVVHLWVGPSIDRQPVNITANPCSLGVITLVGSGVGTVHFQWRIDGAPLSDGGAFAGTTNASLTVGPLIYDHEQHQFDCVVTDDCGPQNAVTSKVANITLPTPPWIEVAMLPNPPEVQARGRWTGCFDENRNVFVMYGGSSFRGDADNSLWEYDGNTWKAIQDAYSGLGITTNGQNLLFNNTTPPSIYAMAYNSDDKKCYLFGEAGRNSPLAVWTWNGQWDRPYAGPLTGGNCGYHLTYDRTIHKMLFVRSSGGCGYTPELLIYDCASNIFTGPITMHPPVDAGIFDAFWIYDESRKKSLWYQNDGVGGIPASTWWYDGVNANWSQLASNSMTFPEYNWFPAFVYDPVRRQTIAEGGGYLDDYGYYTGTWSFPPVLKTNLYANDWQQILPDGAPRVPAGSGVSPSNDYAQEMMAFDRRRRAMVLPGYANAHTNPQWKTYERRYLDAPMFDAPPQFGTAPKGGTAVLSVKAAGWGTLAYRWRRNGTNVVDGPNGASAGGGTVSGSTNAQLTISGLTDSDLGNYDVTVSNACGPVVSPKLALIYTGSCVFSPPVAGNGTFMLTMGAAPGINITLETAPSVAGPWTKKQNLTVPQSGVVQYTDSPATQQVFYRTIYPAY